MRTDLFDYHLPKELIAATPAEKRDASRLLVLHRDSQTLEHAVFARLGNYLTSGDLLVINDSRVIRARLHGKRMATGGHVELLLVERHSPASNAGKDTWLVLCRPARKLKPGEMVYFANKRLTARILHYAGEGERIVEFDCPNVLEWLDQIGEVPLPPYIVQRRRELFGPRHEVLPEDVERYQTVYAREPGSVAAPTAGLHFTTELMESLKQQGVRFARVTLHVGPGTFKPVEAEEIEQHRMHVEHYSIPNETVTAIEETRRMGKRVVAVGTTVVRTLEAAADEEGRVQSGDGATDLMIVPGYRFRVIDALITNFHLPRSTLLMLVAAFAGREFVLRAYEEAVAQRYRFYSYGDAMLIL